MKENKKFRIEVFIWKDGRLKKLVHYFLNENRAVRYAKRLLHKTKVYDENGEMICQYYGGEIMDSDESYS
jgi:hypothetical protein